MPEPTTGIWSYFAIFFALVLAAFGFPIPEEIPVVIAGGLCPTPLRRPARRSRCDALHLGAAHSGNGRPRRDGRRSRSPHRRVPPSAAAPGLVHHAADMHHRRDPLRCDSLRHRPRRRPALLEVGWVKRWLIRPETRDRIEGNFHKYGVRILLGVRLLARRSRAGLRHGRRVATARHRFLLADGLYAILGVTLLFFLAYWFTDQVKEAVMNFTHQIDSYRPYVIAGVIAAVGLFFAYEYWKRRRITGDPKEVPIIGEKLVKPSPTDQFPDSVILSKEAVKRRWPHRSEKTSRPK